MMKPLFQSQDQILSLNGNYSSCIELLYHYRQLICIPCDEFWRKWPIFTKLNHFTCTQDLVMSPIFVEFLSTVVKGHILEVSTTNNKKMILCTGGSFHTLCVNACSISPIFQKFVEDTSNVHLFILNLIILVFSMYKITYFDIFDLEK